MNICTCSSPEMAFSSIERLHGRNMFQLQSKYFHRTCSAKRDSVHVDNCERGRTLVVCNRSVPGHLGEVISGKTQLNGTSRKLKLIRTLLIDNYDSYTYNIFQELSVINGVAPVVIRNDEWQWDDAYHYLYEEKAFDNIVISPGPGSPTCPADIGICLALLSKCRDIPILGVCLGHQALGFVHGAKVVRGIEPVHGRLSDVEHNSCSLFRGIPSGTNSGFKVVRYHSLVIDPQSLPKELVPIAWTSNDVAVPYLGVQGARDRPATESVFVNSSSATNSRRIKPSSDKMMKKNESVLMGIMHTSRPHYGLQFHPESVATCHGRQIFKNFAEITQDHWIRLGSPLSREREELHRAACVQVSDTSQLFNGNGRGSHPVNDIHKHLSTHNMGKPTLSNSSLKFLKLTWKKLPSQASRAGGVRNIFDRIFGHHKGKDTFWLDSSSVEKGRARFSFMGGKGGTLWKQIIFNLPNKSSTMSSASGGHLSIQDAQGSTESIFLKDGFFDFLNKELQSFSYDEKDFEGLPFDFHGGYIGYIGYDLKVECGMASNRHKSTAPDACFFFADNFLVIDHDYDDIYIMSVNDSKSSNKAANWLDDIEHKILMLKFDSTCNDHRIPRQTSSQDSGGFGFVAEKTKQQYINDVERCQRLIRDGESYELCLTTQLKKKMEVKDDDPFGIYLKLREKNPAPYAAWLNFSTEKLSICSSSPERFLRLDKNGNLEAKPIKGTIARGLTKDEDELLKLQLLYSEKDQAENLMIVDLLRNDLGRVCEPGSVHVPHLMEIESYATVHTMVSTIRGEKRSDLSPIDCVRAAFPGGSMTGAPKLRSMELLDNHLETSSRGIYSGCIGYFSYDQTFDLNIVIRTVVIHDDEASIGAGGAITALSSPDEEYKEMILKTKAPANAVYEYESKKENLSIGPDI